MIDKTTHPQGTIVVCIDPPGDDGTILIKGEQYVVECWEGSGSIRVTGVDGICATLNKERFAPKGSKQ